MKLSHFRVIVCLVPVLQMIIKASLLLIFLATVHNYTFVEVHLFDYSAAFMQRQSTLLRSRNPCNLNLQHIAKLSDLFLIQR